MAEVKKASELAKGTRHALTIAQQRAFMEHIANHPVFHHWWPMFTILLGTGCRIGEALGLRWEDLNYEKRTISINHSLTYYPTAEERSSVMHISRPKTESGVRTIPMLDSVKDAFEMLYEEQKENGWSDVEIDGDVYKRQVRVFALKPFRIFKNSRSFLLKSSLNSLPVMILQRIDFSSLVRSPM